VERKDAIRYVCEAMVNQMSEEEKRTLLDEWWVWDDDELISSKFPESLQNALKEEPPQNPNWELFQPLLVLASCHQWIGVTNDYLQTKLQTLDIPGKVVGNVECLEMCPCCECRTLPLRGQYGICNVCFWEDDGTEKPEQYSSPNHMTLGQAKHNYERLGAVDEESSKLVIPDGNLRYLKGKLVVRPRLAPP
jgi:hypothetical protein